MKADVEQVITAALSADVETLSVTPWTPDTLAWQRHRIASPPRRRGFVSRRTVTAAAAATVVLAIASTAAIMTAHSAKHRAAPAAPASNATYALPSNGWMPGAGTREARIVGAFHANLKNGHACAWLGTTQVPSLWPAGWRVRLRPTELIDPNGSVFAREGDVLHTAGGLTTTAAAPKQCGGDISRAVSLTEVQQGP